MKTPVPCKLFGAQQALSGIKDGVILFHSVVGCNFGTMTYHIPNNMQDIRQTCTVLNDTDIIFSGEASLKKAIVNALELFDPKVLFVVSGCVSEMIGDDIPGVLESIESSTPVIYVEAAGFRGNACKGYEAACSALLPFMEPAPKRPNSINILGLGGDDYRLEEDVAAIREMLQEKISVQTVFSCCTWEEIQSAAQASFNLVLDDRGLDLARQMEGQFGIPYVRCSYPYGITGMKALFEILEQQFHLDLQDRQSCLEQETAEACSRVYYYLECLYGIPAAVIGTGSRAEGMKRFLEQELGMEVVCFARREQLQDLEDFYQEVRQSEAALIFGSSFEQGLADELQISLIRYDYPVFDSFSLNNVPFAGPKGVPAILETLLNTVMQHPALKGAFYQ